MHGDEEGRLADGLQHAPFRLGVLRRLPLLHDRRLLQHLHRVQLAAGRAAPLPRQEHLAVRCNRGDNLAIRRLAQYQKNVFSQLYDKKAL